MKKVKIQLSYLSKGKWKNFDNQVKGVIEGIKIKTSSDSSYYLKYRTMNSGRKTYYPYVKSNEEDYAGYKGKNIQQLQIQVYKNNDTKLVSGVVVMYRAFVGSKWLPWVSNADPKWMQNVQEKYKLGGTLDTGSSYAGLPGKDIGGIEIRVYQEDSFDTFVGGVLQGSFSYLVGNVWKSFEKGVIANKIHGIKIQTNPSKDYYLSYKTWNEGCTSYYPAVKSTENDYAGLSGKAIQKLSISVYRKNGNRLTSGIIVMYRVYVDERWLPWVSNADPEWMRNVQVKYSLDGTLDAKASYAGISKKNIKGVEIWIFEEDSLNAGLGSFSGSEINLSTQYMTKNESNWKNFQKSVKASKIEGIKIQTTSNLSFYLGYKTWNQGQSFYYPEVTSTGNDYAGYPQKPIQRLNINVYSKAGKRLESGIIVMYRAYVEGRWLPWVSNGKPDEMQNIQKQYNLDGTLDFVSCYAGIHGKNISGIEIRAFQGKATSVAIGSLSGKEEKVKLAYINNNASWKSFSPSVRANRIDGIRILTDSQKPYYLLYRTWNEGQSSYYPSVKSTGSDYAGYPGKRVQLLNIQVYKKDGTKITTGVVVMYRVYTGGKWLPWVSNADPEWMQSVKEKYNLDGSLDTSAYYAGISGKNIGGVEIHIYEENSLYKSSGSTGKSKIIQVKFISQQGMYPTGCESVSAVMALWHIGIKISVDDFIDKYLPMSGVPFDPDKTFGGSPRWVSGYGCYAPVIKSALNQILLHEDYEAEQLQNQSLSTLCSKYIDKGTPVIIWASINMNEIFVSVKWDFNGKTISWKAPEHCLLLVGYDDKNYIFNDPMKLQPQTYYSKDSVEKAYKKMGSQAIILKRKKANLSKQIILIYKDLYDLAYKYLKGMRGILPVMTYEVNKEVLAYLRKKEPTYASYAWTIIAGYSGEGFANSVKENYPNLKVEDITLTDPVSGIEIGIPHFAATLGSLLYRVTDLPFLESYVDAFAGWAGDLMQAGGTIDAYMRQGGENCFANQNRLQKCIGTQEGELNINVKNEKGKIEVKHSVGFDYMDLVQDVDAYNMARMYSFSELPIYTILDKYYNIDKIPYKRYTKFEKELLQEFGTQSLCETAALFTQLEKLGIMAMNKFFKDKFGSFDYQAYGKDLAKAFEAKILQLKKKE